MAEKNNNLFILNFKYEKIFIQNSGICCSFFTYFLLSFKYYTDTKGDLLRLGFIADIYNYDFNKVFKKEMARKINYTVFSELNLKNKIILQFLLLVILFQSKVLRAIKII
ncbi:hypothetical protein FPS14_contig00030-0018 [Flavobacterium psychrophilum]|nr:hypothetical protein FPS14_contig00030-0018 [Flavobacterium psychrophilum]